jgi:hypothetical protein
MKSQKKQVVKSSPFVIVANVIGVIIIGIMSVFVAILVGLCTPSSKGMI